MSNSNRQATHKRWSAQERDAARLEDLRNRPVLSSAEQQEKDRLESEALKQDTSDDQRRRTSRASQARYQAVTERYDGDNMPDGWDGL